jgi:hypothetical protein
MTNSEHIENIIYVYLRATDSIVEDGMTWYPRARDFCLTLDENLHKAAGVVAVISANVSWSANMTLARKAYMGDLSVGFADKVRKVTRIMSGESPESVVSGQKVKSFFTCIVNPDADMPAVIDRHAYDIAVAKRNGNANRALGKKAYAEFQNSYSEAAGLAGITVPQMQAITWVSWRNMHGIRV